MVVIYAINDRYAVRKKRNAASFLMPLHKGGPAYLLYQDLRVWPNTQITNKVSVRVTQIYNFKTYLTSFSCFSNNVNNGRLVGSIAFSCSI